MVARAHGEEIGSCWLMSIEFHFLHDEKSYGDR